MNHLGIPQWREALNFITLTYFAGITVSSLFFAAIGFKGYAIFLFTAAACLFVPHSISCLLILFFAPAVTIIQQRYVVSYIIIFEFLFMCLAVSGDLPGAILLRSNGALPLYFSAINAASAVLFTYLESRADPVVDRAGADLPRVED